MLKKISMLVLLAAFGLGASVGCKEESGPTPPETPDAPTAGEVEKAVEEGAEQVKEGAEEAAKEGEKALEGVTAP